MHWVAKGGLEEFTGGFIDREDVGLSWFDEEPRADGGELAWLRQKLSRHVADEVGKQEGDQEGGVACAGTNRAAPERGTCSNAR